jgi:hypothetical protein
VARAPRRDDALLEAGLLVGDDELRVDLLLDPEAVALGAGAERAVEGERPRLELLEGQVVVEAGQVLGVGALAVRVALGLVDEVEDDQPAAEPERGLDRVGQPALGGLLDGEAVDDHLDGVLLLLLERRRLGERVHDAVDPRARVALGLQVGEQVDVLALAGPHHRRQHLEAGPSSSSSTRSTICDGCWRAIVRPHFGQCGVPARA